MVKIGIVIPVYNEAQNILRVLEELREKVNPEPSWKNCEVRVFLINDGSIDETKALLESSPLEDWLQVIHLPFNLGIGRAVRIGFMLAMSWGADLFLQLDGDGQHPVDQVSKLIQPLLLEEVDFVVGSRYLCSSSVNVSSSLRKLGTAFLSTFVWLLTRLQVKDVTSGFRAMNGKAAKLLIQHYADDYPEVEFYVLLNQAQLRILEVPVKMRPRLGGKSSIASYHCVYYMTKVTVSTFVTYFRTSLSSGKES